MRINTQHILGFVLFWNKIDVYYIFFNLSGNNQKSRKFHNQISAKTNNTINISASEQIIVDTGFFGNLFTWTILTIFLNHTLCPVVSSGSVQHIQRDLRLSGRAHSKFESKIQCPETAIQCNCSQRYLPIGQLLHHCTNLQKDQKFQHF